LAIYFAGPDSWLVVRCPPSMVTASYVADCSTVFFLLEAVCVPSDNF
jgi:hypothetical protein